MTGLPTRRRRDENGSAVVEFVMLGVVLLLPLVYLVLMLGRVQAAPEEFSEGPGEGGRA